MKRIHNGWRYPLIFLLAASFLNPALGPPPARPAAAKAQTAAPSAPGAGQPADELGGYYDGVLSEWQRQRVPTARHTLALPVASISGQSPEQLALSGEYEGRRDVLLWGSDGDNWIEYQVDVPEDGLYELAVTYHSYTVPGRTSPSFGRRPVHLSLQVDGDFPFREARSLSLRRQFQDELPVKRDDYGDDLRPKSAEVKGWRTEPLADGAGSYAEPFLWRLAKGRHTLRLTGSEPVAIASLELRPQAEVKDYATLSSTYPPEGGSGGGMVVIQAEEAAWKNDVAIQLGSDQDPFTLPHADGYERLNALGGLRWQKGGQTVAWTFEVPRSGRYKIALRAQQKFLQNMSVFRTVAIDGKVPFREVLAYRFPYSTKWKGRMLEDGEGNPYEFYLEKGTHTLSMTATVAPYRKVIIRTMSALSVLRQADQEIRALTGGQVDTRRTWKADRDFPGLPGLLEQARSELKAMADEMLQANGRRDQTVQTIETAMKDLAGYLRYPDEIPYRLEDIAKLTERIGAVPEALAKSPLLLDQLYIIPADEEAPRMEAGFWSRLQGGMQGFVHSFTRKKSIHQVGDDVLNVWVNRGRDYVNLLQEMSDEAFTPQTGIKVKVNLLPNENLLVLANAAGLSPDVALGQPQDKSIDFAMRNALLDVSQFPEFSEVAGQFAPGALVPFYYNGGYYALPETQSFKVLFYRKDILERLNLGVPDTWEDVYAMLPTLQQNGYNFYMPPADYLPFFYQNGAEFFTGDGMRTDLHTAASFRGFKQWTDLFNIYSLEREVPSFYQHFRKGTYPVGVADYNMYMTLQVAAPELAGWWGIAPMPGVPQPDGTVARWAAGGQTTGFIYKNTKHPEKAWTFLKWLVSADVQERYGSDLESYNGIEFRWNTANVEAFAKLPWPKDDLAVILEQWRWYKEVPNLPGSYMLGRELANAWNRTVVDGVNDRESLEEAILNIDREMQRKLQEFGFAGSGGKPQPGLGPPKITAPWKGVDRYAPRSSP